MDEQQEQKFQQMTTEPVGHLIGRLALPCIISMLVTAFYNMADTFFVGMLKSNSATGAVGVVFSLMAIIQAVGFFFGHGSGNFISRELGKHHYEEASNMAATGFFTALAGGVFYLNKGSIYPSGGFGINWTVSIVFIVIIGGIGTMGGPILGAIIYTVLEEMLASYPGYSNIILGLIAILVILFLPDGILGTLQKKFHFEILSQKRFSKE